MRWLKQFWEDLQPTPGRLSTSLRIVLATTVTLILLMTWQIPQAAIGLYLVFLLGRDSPSVSMRGGIVSILTLGAAVVTELALVVLTDNSPMSRVLSVAAVTFLAGMMMRATTIPNNGVLWGFIFCTLIGTWEFHAPAEALVKNSLWLVGAGAVGIGCAVAVEYVFGASNPVARLEEQLRIRYKALENLFTTIGNRATAEEVSAATIQVSRLAASGQTAMQELYNVIADRNLDPRPLPIGSRVHITMLAQLMDISAAFASQHPAVTDPETAERCARIAAECHQLAFPDASIPERQSERTPQPLSTLLDRVETMLQTMRDMPQRDRSEGGKDLIALPAKEVPLLIPGGLSNQDNVAFALKLSLSATVCYIFYQAVDWPGISTSVTTVFFTAVGSTGAAKQKLLFRVLGAAIGGLVFGIGATAFLFPLMDSITSLVVLVAAIAFVAAWCGTGRRFNYVGLQIALAFYFVAFEGFGAPTELAPARDRFVGILVAFVVMWFIFDQMWPVRTVTVMRRALASVLRSDASLLQLGEAGGARSEKLRQANALRDQVGKTVAGLRTMNDAVEYEFGVNRELHLRSSHAILRAAFSAVAMFWNQLVVFHSPDDEDFLRDPRLTEMRRAFAAELNSMADAVAQKATYKPVLAGSFPNGTILDHPRYGEYVRNTVTRFGELQGIVSSLNSESTV
ncbi:MAG TPA: FUSC family protein [Candidatus Sulfotelmatobacter sp.]|nr:FUSC family protein [Candidatus Sulfotelmatobacter sp.]